MSTKSKTKASSKKSAAPKTASYYDLIKGAITELKDRTGSSRQAISKIVSAKKSNFQSGALNRALKSGVESGKLIQVKGSYKLSAAEKKPVATKKKTVKKASVKKTTAKKSPAKKKTSTKKTATKKAPAKKKTTTKKTTKKSPAKKKAPAKKAAPKKKSPAKKKKPAKK